MAVDSFAQVPGFGLPGRLNGLPQLGRDGAGLDLDVFPAQTHVAAQPLDRRGPSGRSREAAREAGCSNLPIQLSSKKLEGWKGIYFKKQFYRSAMHAINSRLTVPLAAIRDFSRRWKITEFALFGSVLREDFRPDSDIDALVTFAPDAPLPGVERHATGATLMPRNQS